MGWSSIVRIATLYFYLFASIEAAKYGEEYRSERRKNRFYTEYEKLAEYYLQSTEGDRTTDIPAVGIDFNCNDYPRFEATSVHRLTPYDIKVVGAMGDSITAAFGAGADSFIGDLGLEYRGVSWSIGGDETVETVGTLPNLIKKYNSQVSGFSVGIGDEESENAKNNVAKSGGIVHDMPHQATTLVNKIKADENIDIDRDWKLITIFIGGNNLCRYCPKTQEQNESSVLKHSALSYYLFLREALDILQRELPRTFVNVAMILDVSVMAPLRETSDLCDLVHGIACPCQSHELLPLGTRLYQAATDYLVNSGRYDQNNDFTVVIQPMFVDTVLPTIDGTDVPDTSYFAPDCYHFSTKGSKEAAVALWNNMLQRVGEKSTSWVPGQDILCPNEQTPFFFTSKNSI